MRKNYLLFLKLFIPFLLIVLIPLLAFSRYAGYSMRKFYLEQTTLNLEARANLLKEQVSYYLLTSDEKNDEKNIDLFCKRAGKSSGTRITVILLSGKVIGDSDKNPDEMENHADRPEFVKAITGETGVFTRYSDTLNTSMMYLAVLLSEDGKPVGVLRTSVSISAIDKQLEIIQKRTSLGALVVALLAALAALLFSRHISSPLEKIREGASHFAKGDLSYRLPVFASAETELLAKTMNDMAANLDERMQTIIRQRNELEAVLSSMTEGVIAVNPEEKIISVNRSAARMFHRDPSELLNRSVQETVRNPDFQRFVRISILDENSHEEDLSFHLKDESLLNTRSAPLKNAAGERIGVLIILNDVTRLRHLENMRRDFAANVSHEIKTPLTAIKGFTETLKSGALNRPEEAARFVEIIENHTNRLIAIIEDLMKLSIIEQSADDKTIRQTECRVLPLLSSAIKTCLPKADEKRIRILCSCDEALSSKLNAALIEQAFVNLLDNAVKYSDPGSSIEIEGAKNDSEVSIAFQDHGIGIGQEHLSRLFERFYRVDASRSRKMGGTGLGLAIVKHIVIANAGNISVKSAPGEGSCFVIHLPFQAS
ncbi:MAG: HAMP domain-containing protein [Desulfobacteraceae bacterium]|nr:MAG: HAMP domain-containing protein [Desulfobacteraceae bacterium]